MAITWDNVVRIAPELDPSVDARITTELQDEILADVLNELSATALATQYDKACKYLCAHLATLALRRGVAGSVQSESVGSVSRAYAISVASGQEQLSSTAYGVEYERTIRTVAGLRIASSGL